MSFETLYQNTIANNLCVECGACAAVCPVQAINYLPHEVGSDPVLTGQCLGERCRQCVGACPGGEVPMAELEKYIFGRTRDWQTIERHLGVFKYSSVGRAVDKEIKNKGASGSVVTAVLLYALDHGIIDAAVVSGTDPKKPWLARPVVATTRTQLINAAGSKYNSVHQIAGLQEAVARGYKKIAVVGTPCVIHAVRKMQFTGIYRKLVDHLVLTVGLWCSTRFTARSTEFLIQNRLGVPLDEVKDFSYRAKPWPDRFQVITRDNRVVGEPWLSLSIAGRLTGPFKPCGCEDCLDATAELADLSMGDSWGHPAMSPEELNRGNVYTTTIIRTEVAEKLFKAVGKAGYVFCQLVAKADSNFITRHNGSVITKIHGNAPKVRLKTKRGLAVRDYGKMHAQLLKEKKIVQV